MGTSNHVQDLLALWYPRRKDENWVLGTVYQTEGPTYRKAGAMMLFNDLGQHFGLLSGGCLEADIQNQAARALQSKQALTLCYDGSDEDDISFQLGIGCGGTVYILLQPLTLDNHYLGLEQAYQSLQAGHNGTLWQQIPETQGPVQAHWQPNKTNTPKDRTTTARLIKQEDGVWLASPLRTPPRLLVIGAGVDTRPLVTMASTLGWRVTLWDSRPANARSAYFPTADNVLRCPIDELGEAIRQQPCDAAIAMSHNLKMDASAIKQLHNLQLDYLALLGPKVRRTRVLELAGLNEESLACELSGPAGFNIGGELPEGIALSILAECHARLFLNTKE